MGLTKFLTGGVINRLTDYASELTTDKDKLVEFEYRARELLQEADSELLESKTTPFMDATVKFMLASKQFIRPFGAFALSSAGFYLHLKGITVEPALHALLDGAFPGWMYSRHTTLREATK